MLAIAPAAWAAESHSAKDFRNYIESLWPLAEQRGVSADTFAQTFRNVVFDPGVIGASSRQAEFSEPISSYVAAAAAPARIERGRAKAAIRSSWLAKANDVYGVDASVILGIWGLESDFGDAPGRADVIQELASLAFIRYRDPLFRDQLIVALALLAEGRIQRNDLRGSWAGAMGQTQFIPSSYWLYAADFDGDIRKDIWRRDPDAVASIANFLAVHGWARGLPWGFEVGLPANFVLTAADSARMSDWKTFSDRGVRRSDGLPFPTFGQGRLFLPAGIAGPVFVTTPNFEVIQAYNASSSYALAVCLLGDAILRPGMAPLPWPDKAAVLTPPQVAKLQTKLKSLGYDAGPVDGLVGDVLRSAVRAFQEREGLPPDGYADLALFKRIDAEK